MGGPKRVPVRSYGSEVPEPEAGDLTGWIGKRKGIGGDLTSYLLEESLEPQEGVDFPCAGGRIYRARVLESIGGLEGEALAREPSAETALVEEDARWGASRRRGLLFSLPAPHLLGIRDDHYHDREEFCEALSGCYRRILRAMRDAGAGGHVLLGKKVHGEEMEHLAGPRTLFFFPGLSGEDLPVLLEAQGEIAVPRELLPAALDLLDEFEIRHLAVVDGRAEDLSAVLEYLDPGQVSLGGYCTEDCGKYWKALVERAVIPRQTRPPRRDRRSTGSSG
ncbi:MAG: hypothetical protein LUO96_02440 [Methanomicrobiales archaeon]|nr:hypothetical protein [Methanomicrobiales archaeon]